ncbi:MAG: ethanolamine ammonia lyase large subunit, partial [Betaproteobacteria bacterium]|nr:ethanolamine ammonia lyase large subunit [Betaproteobacteria bacterium]
MSQFTHTIGVRSYRFADLKDLMAKATPPRSGDYLSGVAAANGEQRIAAQMTLAALP